MIQKMQKTAEILQVQFIDKVVEISEITQSKDKCQRSRRNGNSWKFTDKTVDVPVMLERQCQPSAQVFDQVSTTGAKDAKMHKDPHVSPQATQTPSAKTRFTRKGPWPFWLKPFPVRTCVRFFCVTSFSCFVLFWCLQPSFVFPTCSHGVC